MVPAEARALGIVYDDLFQVDVQTPIGHLLAVMRTVSELLAFPRVLARRWNRSHPPHESSSCLNPMSCLVQILNDENVAEWSANT